MPGPVFAAVNGRRRTLGPVYAPVHRGRRMPVPFCARVRGERRMPGQAGSPVTDHLEEM